MKNLCNIGHHLWGIGDEKPIEGLRGIRPFTCGRCGVMQLMNSRISGNFNSYCLRDKRLSKKTRAILMVVKSK